MNTVEKLEQMGGKYWERGDKRRVYFDPAIVLGFAGLETQRYGTGNISSAKLNGEKISNSRARRIASAFHYCKFYYDCTDGEFHYTDRYGDLGQWVELAQAALHAMRAKLEE